MAKPAAHKRAYSIAALTSALMLGACAQSGDGLQTSMLDPVASEVPRPLKTASLPQTDLEKATEYWGKKYREKPTDLEAALSFAKNLKAMGERQQALGVIQAVAVYHSGDRALASEYGRLALELDQVSIAKQMLAVADDPANPDWRVISARGTVAAKEGKVRDAINLYERALTLSQEQTSVMNNLAMAYAMDGDAAKAEGMLRRIEAKGGSAKTRQNLALVLGLQGKFDEAKQTASKDLGSVGAHDDTEYLKRMVKVEKPAAWTTTSMTPKQTQAQAATAAAQAATAAAAIASAPQTSPAAETAAWQGEIGPATAAVAGGPILKGMR